MKAIRVTAAIIERNGKVLIARRSPGGRHPGRWEFPGGKIEKDESPEQCLAREMAEEMRVEVSVTEEMGRARHAYPDLTVELIAFRCEILTGDLKDLGCAAHAWVEPGKLGDYDLLPPDRELLRKVVQPSRNPK